MAAALCAVGTLLALTSASYFVALKLPHRRLRLFVAAREELSPNVRIGPRQVGFSIGFIQLQKSTVISSLQHVIGRSSATPVKKGGRLELQSIENPRTHLAAVTISTVEPADLLLRSRVLLTRGGRTIPPAGGFDGSVPCGVRIVDLQSATAPAVPVAWIELSPDALRYADLLRSGTWVPVILGDGPCPAWLTPSLTPTSSPTISPTETPTSVPTLAKQRKKRRHWCRCPN